MIDFTSPGFPGRLYRSSPIGAGGVSGSHPPDQWWLDTKLELSGAQVFDQ
jgi:hypothetical protein